MREYDSVGRRSKRGGKEEVGYIFLQTNSKPKYECCVCVCVRVRAAKFNLMY